MKAEGGFGSLNGVVLTPATEAGERTLPSLDIPGTEKAPVLLEVSSAGKILPATEGGEYELLLNLPPYESVTWFAAEAGRWPSGCNRVLPWSAASLEHALNLRNPAAGGSPDSHGMLALFRLKNGNYLVLLPLCGSGSVSWLEAEGNTLRVKSGTLGTSAMADAKEPMLCSGVSRNLYEAMRATWEKAVSHPRLKRHSGWRCTKDAHYPEPFRYLGWAVGNNTAAASMRTCCCVPPGPLTNPPFRYAGCWWTRDSRLPAASSNCAPSFRTGKNFRRDGPLF